MRRELDKNRQELARDEQQLPSDLVTNANEIKSVERKDQRRTPTILTVDQISDELRWKITFADIHQNADHVTHLMMQKRIDPKTEHNAPIRTLHFDSNTLWFLMVWVRGVNAHLLQGIRVLWARNVDVDFHACFFAFERSYQYFLINQSVVPVIMVGRAGWFHASFDLVAMRKVVSYLVGEHDFSVFRVSEC
jgi:Pseudouridylate synthase